MDIIPQVVKDVYKQIPIQQWHRSSPTLQLLCKMLEGQFNCPTEDSRAVLPGIHGVARVLLLSIELQSLEWPLWVELRAALIKDACTSVQKCKYQSKGNGTQPQTLR